MLLKVYNNPPKRLLFLCRFSIIIVISVCLSRSAKLMDSGLSAIEDLFTLGYGLIVSEC